MRLTEAKSINMGRVYSRESGEERGIGSSTRRTQHNEEADQDITEVQK